MFEFLIKMGLVTGGAVVAGIFIVVFSLAESGKEISFWGIRFHKKWRQRKRRSWRRLPRPMPEEWRVILKAFADRDAPRLRESDLFNLAHAISGFSEMKTREVCVEMNKYGLMDHLTSYYVLRDKAFAHVNAIRQECV